MRISNILRGDRVRLSCEVFPPKKFDGIAHACETAQEIANIGIRGLWNFTSTELDLKIHGIMVENVHMGDSLMRLMYEINNNEQLNET